MFLFSLLAIFAGTSLAASWNITSFKIDLSENAERMNTLVATYRLPERPVYPDLGFSYGTDLDWLKARQETWAHDFDWNKTQAHMNRFTHQKVTIENVTLHFIHHRSSDPSAIPIIMTHGWPGSFYEFDRVIEPLANPPKGQQAFHVVVPSLPGFGLSSHPPSFSWNNNDTARVFNILMTDVLGYKNFGAEGGDLGSSITWLLMNNHPKCRAVVMTNFVASPLTLAQYNATWPNQTAHLSASDLDGIARAEEWLTSGNGYFLEQSTKPATIGLALYDNPIGQLSWIGQPMISWSDPNSNIATFSNYTILEEVSIYFLTNTIETSALWYAQNVGAFSSYPAAVRTPVGLSEFKYDPLHLPTFRIEQLANVTYHVKHDSGGHFAALENPNALIGDIRAFFQKNWPVGA